MLGRLGQWWRSSGDTHNAPVHVLQALLADENIIDAGAECAHYTNDNTEHIHPMPELFHLMRVGLHHVEQDAEDQTDLGTPEEDTEHSIVRRKDIVKLRLA